MKNTQKLVNWSLLGAIAFIGIQTTLPLRALTQTPNIIQSNKQNNNTTIEQLITEINELRKQGKQTEAVSLLKKSITEQEQTVGKNHPNIAFLENQLGEVYFDQANYQQAEVSLQKAQSILEKNNNLDNQLGATILNNLGLLYYSQGKYSQTESPLLRALNILETTKGENSLLIASTLNYLADLYRAQGNYPQAESYYQRNLTIIKNNLGAEHPVVAVSLNDLGSLYSQQEQYDKAEPILQQALAISEKDNKESSLVAASLNNLAALYSEQKRYQEAEPLLERALSILEKNYGSNHPDVGSSLNNLATLYSEQGKYQEAEPLLIRALSILKQVKGSEHPLVSTTLNNLSWLYRQTGDTTKAIDLLTQATDIEETNISLVLSSGSENQKQAYMATLSDSTKAAISLHAQISPNSPQALRLALTTVLRRKGRILDALTENLQALKANLTPEDQILLDKLANIRTELSALIFKGVGSDNPEQYQQEIAKLHSESEQIEVTLARRSAQFRTQSQAVTIESVQKLIPDDGVLVEMVLYEPYDNSKKDWGSPRYIAYILPKQGDAQWVDLGDADTINQAMVEFRKTIIGRSNSVKQTGKIFYDLVFAPIRKIVGNTPKILLSPDSQLNLMPFAALTDENGQYLLENFSIIYLSTGRDLIRLQNSTNPKQTPVVIADPDYDQPGNSNSRQLYANSRSIIPRSSQLSTVQVPPLPGTAAEARAITPLLEGVTVLTRSDATENALKQVNSPMLLHIATHGFFFSFIKNENPLLLSGLALAGFNPRESGTEDGVLTALEAAGLNLQGTKLVVLSACETGLGEVANGEGVYGLRRAFVMAGSETQIISLWQVDDLGTKDLMVGYYQGIYQGQPRGEALREQQLKMLSNTKYEHPYFWAAFIPSGDWRAVQLALW
ncbi:MAG: tetratricopeptide repeat protein [Chloroflexi bacterium AL-N10]|nr:tetratricopeptide repeat protein [Chloroflexi bacterium AL-N10]NOK92747.1 tetratricopeptide repeat protein [Chloroflexi bacterium AL-N15]